MALRTDEVDKLGQLVDIFKQYLQTRTNDYVVTTVDLAIIRNLNIVSGCLVLRPPATGWYRWWSVIQNTGTFNIILNESQKQPIPVSIGAIPNATMDFQSIYVTNIAQPGLAATIIVGWHRPYDEIKFYKDGKS